MPEQDNQTDATDEIRKQKLLELRQKVDLAWANPKQVQLVERIKDSEEALVRAAVVRERLEDHEDDKIVPLGQYVETPSIVVVEDPDLYASLLRMAVDKIHASQADELLKALGDLVPNSTRGQALIQLLLEREAENFVQRKNQHELEHAKHGQGEQGLEIRYAVEFSQDQTGKRGIKPLLVLNGYARAGVIRQMIRGASNPSPTDIIQGNISNG